MDRTAFTFPLAFPLVFTFALAFAFAGCYTDRWTQHYIPLLDAEAAQNAILEESGQDEESERQRIEYLKKLAESEIEAYRINAGDVVEIRVYGHPDVGVKTRVGPDGTVGMVFLGQARLAGKTITEARDTVEQGLAPYIKHPIASVTVMDVAGETVTVSGAARNPGLYSISSSSRLADAYAMAGGSAERLFNGIDVDVADLEHSMLVRGDEILPVDFRAAIEQGDPLNNVRLHKGDYIFIAQRMESSITLCGEVKNPQRRLYESGMGLIEFLTAAGWMNDTHWSHVIIIRDGIANPKMFKVDVDGILAGKCKNILLKPNDIIYVPKDNLSEYNVFVKKLLPSVQIFNLIKTAVSTPWSQD